MSRKAILFIDDSNGCEKTRKILQKARSNWDLDAAEKDSRPKRLLHLRQRGSSGNQ